MALTRESRLTLEARCHASRNAGARHGGKDRVRAGAEHPAHLENEPLIRYQIQEDARVEKIFEEGHPPRVLKPTPCCA